MDANAQNGRGGERERIAILLVDDHALVRAGVREILETQEDLVVVGEAASSEEAVRQVALLLPDIVILDIEIPGNESTVTVSRMRELSPDTQIIVLSMYDSVQLLRQLIATGIRGYLLKTVDRHELFAAIRSAHKRSGSMMISVSQESLTMLHGDNELTLSVRERQILEMVAQAMSNSQISHRLDITEATVKRHLRNIFVKLGAVSRIDAVNRAIDAQLITSRPDKSSRPRSGA
jgi:DNA-binding NarL/FixJ family response regulator